MNDYELSIRTDRRWCDALEDAHGMSVEDLLTAKLHTLIRQLPQEKQEQVQACIRQEALRNAARMAASDNYSVLRVTERGWTDAILVEDCDFLQIADNLCRYIRGEDHFAPRFVDRFQCPVPLSGEEYGGCVMEYLGGTGRVAGVFDVCFRSDRRTVSTMDKDGVWCSYEANDVAGAVRAVCQSASAANAASASRFEALLADKRRPAPVKPVLLRGPEELPLEKITFSGEISETDQLLEFYIDVNFDVDAVFGTHVCTSENDNWLNVYASYDLERGCVCDTLDIELVLASGAELCCEYRLSEGERSSLLSRMEDYCQRSLGVTLEAERAAYLSEQECGGELVMEPI